MKTRHILFSIALGATFAACSSEDNFGIAVDNTTDAKLSIRPLVDAEIFFGGETASTRIGLGNGARPVWSTNDQLGACIIDIPGYTDAADYASKLTTANGAKIKLYKITNSYGCNNAFVTSDAGKTWKAEHPMVEGNYLFYAPYQEELSMRSPLAVCVPLTQDASKEKKALEDFYNGKNIVRVGYQFLEGGTGGTQKPSVKMYDIFAYPKFKITNNFNGYLFDAATADATSTGTYQGAMTIDKVEFYAVNASSNRSAISDVVVGGILSHTDQTNANNTALEAEAGVIKQLCEKANGFAADGAWGVPASMLSAKTADLLATGATQIQTAADVPSGRVAGLITTLNVGQTVESGKSLELYCVMPAVDFNFDTKSLMAKVYVTINGEEYIIYDGVLKAKASELNTAADAGYLFDSKGNAGLSSLTLLNGQKLPAEAIRIDENGALVAKESVNDLLEIKLEGGLKGTDASTKNVQIAVKKNASVAGVTTNEELISMISNAANGTSWDEAEVANTKKYTINPTNSIVINSTLVDALADNNGKGQFAITTVVPIANDVEITAADKSASTITLKSASGKTYTIKLNEAVITNASAVGKYVLMTDFNITPSNLSNKSVVVISKVDGSISTSGAGVAVKSLHVIVGGKLTIADGANAFTADNIRNDGTIEVNGTIIAKNLMNNGTIEIKHANATFTVTAGTGTVTMAEAITLVGAVTIAEGADQQVEYVTTGAFGNDQVGKIKKTFNAVVATGATTLTAENIAALKTVGIKRIKLLNGSLTTLKSCDLKGITFELATTTTWTGTSSAETIIDNATIEMGANALTLTTISVNGTKTGTGVLTATAPGAKWNGGTSPVQ